MAEENEERVKALEAELKRARDEAAERRIKVREYEEAEEKRQTQLKAREEEEARKRGEFEKIDAERKAELEALKRSNAQREANMKKRLIDEAIKARCADAVDPDVIKLIDRKGVEVDSETFEVTGIDDVVKTFRESKPHFFKGAEEPRTPSTPAPPRNNGNGDAKLDWTNLPKDQMDAKLRAEYGLT